MTDKETLKRHLELLKVVLRGHQNIKAAAIKECKVTEQMIKMIKERIKEDEI